MCIRDSYNEVSRGGQVFFIHNNILTIERLCLSLKSLCPEISLSFIHSKLNRPLIKNRMDAFINNKINILVSTSIVESGLDIPNANTIIVNNSHLFGLSQLYQLRGRVGRSNLQSYAFFLIPKKRVPYKKLYIERLRALQEYSSLGVGYNLSLIHI